MIKFVTFDLYNTTGGNTPYAKVAVVIDKVTCLISDEKEPEFTYIYLAEGVSENGANYARVRGSLEETMLTIMAADAEHDLSTDEKWAPADHWTLI